MIAPDAIVSALLRRVWPRLRMPRIYYDPAYRLPLSGIESISGIEPRRADLVVWYLAAERLLSMREVKRPPKARWQALARVHTEDYLESLGRAETLARIFACQPSEVPVDAVLGTVRLACGGTIAAAKQAIATGRPAVNLLGGFHHAAPDYGGGLCPLNDIAVAIAELRAEGVRGQVAVLDLDAHPPDGTAACLEHDAAAWIGSLSGSDWGPLEGVDETVLPPGTGDAAYLAALDALLARMPAPRLAFVIAGGDVLAGDRLGQLALTLEGVRERDARVAAALEGVPSVWLPGGGYQVASWKVLAGTVLTLADQRERPIRDAEDPLMRHYAFVASALDPARLGGGFELREEDITGDLTGHESVRPLFLGYYSAEGLEYALYRYGLIQFIERLGYASFRAVIEPASAGGDRARLYGRVRGAEHLLIDLVAERQRLDGTDVLYIHWLTLRNPMAAFGGTRPRLPGQEVPGLGLAREVGELLARMAHRLGLAGVVFRPAWYHTAYAARHRFRFVDPRRQGRFEALVRDLGDRPLLEASLAVSEGRVHLNGAPYAWEADELVFWLQPVEVDEAAVVAERERTHYTVEARRRAHGSSTRSR